VDGTGSGVEGLGVIGLVLEVDAEALGDAVLEVVVIGVVDALVV
jgi:hypothetical protein